MSTVDLGDVGAGQDDCDQLDKGQDDPDASVDDHHGQDIGLKLVLEKSHAAVDEDLVSDRIWTIFEDVAAASLMGLVTAGVWHREVCADWGRSVVVVADQVVITSAAVQVALELVPLGGDGWVGAVLVQVLVDGGSGDAGLRDGRPELEGDEDRAELGEEGDGQENGVDGQEESLFGARNCESEEADKEGVDAEGDHVGGHDCEVGWPEVELVDVVELHEYDGREDEDGGGDEEEDVAQVEVLLVFGGLALHHRQSRLVRSWSEHRHFEVFYFWRFFLSNHKNCNNLHFNIWTI